MSWTSADLASLKRNAVAAGNKAAVDAIDSSERQKVLRGRVPTGIDDSPSARFLRRWEDANGPRLAREFHFHPEREWRFDFAFVVLDRGGGVAGCSGIAIEVDGGIYSQGRHTRGKGFAADVEKLNAATAMGWRVFRVTTDHLDDGKTIPQILAAVKSVNPLAGVADSLAEAKVVLAKERNSCRKRTAPNAK